MKVAILSFAHENAETYARLLRDLPGIELVTADPDGTPEDQARDRATAERLGVSYVDSWDELLAPPPAAVVVTGEVERRVELVERAAEAGAPVLCEYPLAVKETDLKSMVDACDLGGVRLTLASPACYSDAFATVRKGIADGVVGELTTVHGSYNTRPGKDGGALGANAPYLLDLVDSVLHGEPAEQVYAQTNTVLSGRSGVESAAVVTVRYRSGQVASFDCSWSLSGAAGPPTVTFIGDKASVEFNATPQLLRGFDAATGGERWEPGGGELYSSMLKDFLGTVETGAGIGPDGAAGLRTMRIVQAAHESANTGRPVDLVVPSGH
ncbi:NADH-dependent dehydrogenase [Amycolatopsis ultiminotia]|uniref:NADH-dependent dehydrogenase n=1 Tax=Amycolatopsis ultiminotia TaxID=543629 RepID=A0ABP6WU70_9PSEU